jgi:hypothetical protein
MSVFNPDLETANPLETLVGEGKKYATVDELAKAYLHAEPTIEQRNRENAQLREELATRVTMEQLLEKISNPTPKLEVTPEAHQPAKPALSQDDVNKLVRDALTEQEQNRAVAQNVNTVTAKLLEAYGSEEKANQVIKQRAQELGVSVDFLQDVAAKSPKAFFTTIGLDAQPKVPGSTDRSDVNATALGNQAVKAGTYKWYDQIRKTDPVKYFSPQVQNQMHKDALAAGESFFN